MNKKKSLKHSSTARIAFCGVFAALTIVLLYFGGLTVLDLSLLVLCSVVTVVVTIETGYRYGVIYAAATSVLALVLLPSKLYAVEYLLFSAAYPLLRPLIERIPIKALAFCSKIATLDVMLLACILLGQFVLNAGDEFFVLGWLTMAGGTAFFVLYDIALSKAITFYLVKLRKIIGINKIL